MSALFYDFHIHSCLSPCADNNMTPFDIAGMAKVCGLQIVALTDHNSCLNCPAFFAGCEHYGVIPIPGMELTTAEEIHLVCLFSALEQAMDFSNTVKNRLMKLKNRPDIFGEQIIYSPKEKVTGISEDLLAAASNITLEEAAELTSCFGGVCYPAHVDRESNGIIAVLGAMPEKPDFKNIEVSQNCDVNELIKNNPCLSSKRILFGSDAHSLDAIPDASAFLQLECDISNSEETRVKIIEFLKA